MAKTMARLKDGIVVNLECFDDSTKESDELRHIHDLHIVVGDKYVNGKFYRDNAEIVPYRKQIRNMVKDYDAALTEIAEYVSAPVVISEGEYLSIKSRKQAILSVISSIKAALETSEGGM